MLMNGYFNFGETIVALLACPSPDFQFSDLDVIIRNQLLNHFYIPRELFNPVNILLQNTPKLWINIILNGHVCS